MADARILALSSLYPLFHSRKPKLYSSFPVFSFCFPWNRSTFKIRSTPITSSSSSQNGDFDIVSAKEKPDGSLVFQFGEASENAKNVEAGSELEITYEEPATCSKEEELVHSVRLVDLSTRDGILSVDDLEDVKVASPVDKSGPVDVKDEISGGNCNYTTAASELEIEVAVTFPSEAGMKENFEVHELDPTTPKTAPNNIREQQANMAVDSEPSKALYDKFTDEKLTYDALDDEHVEKQTHHLLDKEVAELAASNESVGHKRVESTNMVTNSVMNAQPTDGAVVEEPAEPKTQATALDGEPLVSDEIVERLELLDVNFPSSNRIEEIATSSDGLDGDVSMPLPASQIRDSTITMEGTSTTPPIFLFSGAASLPHPSKALTGGEDAYFVHENWLGVADGVGQWSLEGISAGVYAQELMKNCEQTVADSISIPITEPVEVLNKASEKTLSPGSSTALVANFDGQALRVANIGDSGFLIIRSGFTFKKSSRMVHEFNFPVQIEKGDNPSELVEEYDINLDEGDIIITGTDGLFDNLYDQEIASIVCNSLEAGMNLQEIAELVAERAQKVGHSKSVRSPFADEAQAAGYVGYNGGKLDDVTVILSLVHQASSHI